MRSRTRRSRQGLRRSFSLCCSWQSTTCCMTFETERAWLVLYCSQKMIHRQAKCCVRRSRTCCSVRRPLRNSTPSLRTSPASNCPACRTSSTTRPQGTLHCPTSPLHSQTWDCETWMTADTCTRMTKPTPSRRAVRVKAMRPLRRRVRGRTVTRVTVTRAAVRTARTVTTTVRVAAQVAVTADGLRRASNNPSIRRCQPLVRRRKVLPRRQQRSPLTSWSSWPPVRTVRSPSAAWRAVWRMPKGNRCWRQGPGRGCPSSTL
mmetsp:Transcript_73601/g.124008  ORF Transcript_73601/g.124008 Transcript_73601/m.124008 type:complete len:261 (-) Transcript_73601:1291-2073(-)